MNSSSTLVATVSINYEDFTEGFLTCGTCLITYDQAEHAPKLLSCSHTICQSCLELIASSPSLNTSTEAGCIKCPICRTNITIPSGGIGALPPSFLVNQLFDLVNKKPREFIPKCSVHIEQELLFCETCDCVFCDTCNNNSDDSDDSLTSSSAPPSLTTTSTNTTNSSSNAATIISATQAINKQTKQHINEVCTVIPFSTAIKRMSEILNYRSQQCLSKLDEARDNIQREIDKLESNCRDTIADIENAFENIKTVVEEREKGLLSETKELHEFKRKVLEEQLKTIESEKSNLQSNSNIRVNNETDVKNLTKKISDLTEKNDTALALYTPRENCFICFENEDEATLKSMRISINEYGRIRTSKTYPPYCTSRIVHYATHLRSIAIVQSIDYNGAEQDFGRDPIQAELRLVGRNGKIDCDIAIKDNRNGTYEVSFTPPIPGKYQLFIYIFNRPIKDCPLHFETSNHHNPVAVFGRSTKKGEADKFDCFSQPASLVINRHNGRVFVLDSFNSRIKVLAQIDSKECPFSFMHHIQPEYLNRSCTGIALLYPETQSECDEHSIQTLSLSPTKPPNPNILVTDWRNRIIYELNQDGKLIRQITHDDLLEPTNIVVDSKGRIFIVDRESIFLFTPGGKLMRRLIGYKHLGNLLMDTNCGRKDTLEDSVCMKRVESLYDSNKMSAGATELASFTHQTNNKENIINNIKSNKTPTTLNTYLINDLSGKPSAKGGTLSSLISLKRKPKLNSGVTIHKGSKAVLSAAASRIRSTFTLSHSTSLVSAASLQSMFISNKHNTVNNNCTSNNANSLSSHNHQHSYDSHFVGLHEGSHVGGGAGANNNAAAPSKQKSQTISQGNGREGLIKQQTLPVAIEQEEAVSHQSGGFNDEPNMNSGTVEPFGIIRGIAIGPDDELIVADESKVRVIEQLGDEYSLKRELLVHSRAINSHHQSGAQHHFNNSHHHQSGAVGRLCAMTYDEPSGQLLILRSDPNCATSAYIQVVDYQSGKARFNIDSHSSKLIRPTGLAIHEQHVVVTDLANDCIKKYRFY